MNKEIINYRSNDQREQIEYILKELKKRLFINISNNSNILNEEYIYILLDILNSIDRFIMIGTDVYQYFDRDFLDIIKSNKKILAKINSIRNELFRILLNINEGKNDINNIKKVTGLNVLLGIILGLIFLIPTLFFPKLIIHFFSYDPNVIKLCIDYFSIIAFCYPLIAVSTVFSMGS